MGKNGKTNRATAVSLAAAAIAGVEKYLANAAKLTLVGVDYTKASIVAELAGELDAIRALDALKAQMSQQVATTRRAREGGRALRGALRRYLLCTYGPEAVQVLGDFGMTAPKKPGPTASAVKAESAAKGRATRKAREEAIQEIASAGPTKP